MKMEWIATHLGVKVKCKVAREKESIACDDPNQIIIIDEVDNVLIDKEVKLVCNQKTRMSKVIGLTATCLGT